jgi:hypothetical protein
LVWLDLAGMRALDDTQLGALVSATPPRLRSLDLSGSLVTWRGLPRLSSLHCLRALVLAPRHTPDPRHEAALGCLAPLTQVNTGDVTMLLRV